MAQISYGTITITDTNDVESIVVEYNRNQSTTTPPAQTDSGWSTNRPTWAQGYYIWQRTRTHKSGTQASADILGNAVCITGSTGQSGTPGKGITGIETLYATNNSTTTAPTSGWQSQPPTYNSSKPKYWVKVTTTYNSGNPTVVTYLDNGITDAMATAAAANNSATEALSKTQAKYATSSTGATIQAKVAIFNPAVTTWSLFNGAEIFVKFTNKNNVANPTLSVKPSSSGSGTTAKTIRDSDGNALDSKFYWGDNSLVHFVYDGTYWRILDIVTTAKYNSMVSDIDGMSSTIGTHTTRLNGLDELTATHETKITQTANSITSLVSNEETYTKPDGTTGTNEIYSAIKQNEDSINLKVDKNGVIAAINLSTETSGGSTAKISADKVNIEGATIFTSGRLSSESLNNTYDLKGSIYDSGNMLLDAYAPSLTKINAKYNRYFSDASNTSTVCSFVSAEDEVLPDPNAKYFVRIKNTELNKYRALCFYGSANYENATGLVVGDTYKVSCWVRQLEGSSNFFINLGGVGGKNYTDTTFVPSTEWQKYEKVFTFTDHNKSSTTVWSRLYFYNRAGSEINGAGTGIGQIDMCGFKLERINAITSSGRNLCLRSADYSGWDKNNGVTFDGNIITFPTATTNTWRSAWVGNPLPYSAVRNQKITVTFKIKGTAGEILSPYFSFGLNSDSTRRLKFVDKYQPMYGTGEWQTVALSMYVNDFAFVSGSGSPNYDSCYFEIQLGATGDTNGRNGFQMKEVMVALGSDPCAWSPAPEDMVAQEQRIYYRTNTTSAPDAPLTLVASTATANDTWTTKRMQYDEIYPYLFTCIQRINIGGTVSNTDVLLDDTTTVIDGGNIIAGSVTANQLATDAIKSLDYSAPASGSQFSTKGTFFNLADQGEFRSKNFAIDKNGNAYFNGALTATSLTIAPGATFDGDIDRFKGASFGWNLVRGTNALANGNGYWSTGTWRTTASGGTVAYNQDIADSPVPSVTKGAIITATSANTSIGIVQDRCPIRKEQITQSVWVKGSAGDKVRLQPIWSDASGASESGAKDITLADGNWTHIEWSKTPAYAHDSVSLCYVVYYAKTAGNTLTICCPKIEYGSLASEWCPAEDEVHGADGKDGISTVGLAMKVNYSGFATASGGECYFHGYNDQNEEADVNGWIIWNGEKLTITKGMWINPNGAVPVNTPIFHVFRTSASPYHSDVWWDSSLLTWRGYAYTADKVPGTKANWTWNEATDCILAVYVATGNEAISSAQLFTTPKKFSELPNPSDIHSIVDTSIDAIEIGGKNLLRASEKLNQAWTTEQATISTSTGVATLTRTGSGNCRIYQMPANAYWTWEAGVKYTASVEAKASENGVVLSFDCNSSGTITYDNNRRPSLTTEWKRYSCTFTITGTVSTGSMTYSMATTTTGKTIYLRKPMLERGNKPSDWSPAPEDEANARKLLIREVTSGSTQGIEVGYENGSYKAFINAAGSFDVINAAGDTVATFGESVEMRSSNSGSGEMADWWNKENIFRIEPDKMSLELRMDPDTTDELTQRTDISAWGIDPVLIQHPPQEEGDIPYTAEFILGDGVYAPGKTKLWWDPYNGEINNGVSWLDGECFVAGWITGGGKELMFTIPLTMPITENTGIWLGNSRTDEDGSSYMELTVRQNNKYILGSANAGVEVIHDSATVWDSLEIEPSPSGINVHYYRSSAMSNYINNDACGIKVVYSFVLINADV